MPPTKNANSPALPDAALSSTCSLSVPSPTACPSLFNRVSTSQHSHVDVALYLAHDASWSHDTLRASYGKTAKQKRCLETIG